MMHERLGPQRHRLRPLLHEDQLPILEPERDQLAIVVDVEVLLAGAVFDLAAQVPAHVVAVDVDLVRPAVGLVAAQQPVLDVGCTRRCEDGELVFFSLRNGVIPASGQVLKCGPLSVE
jgi:hypothetical protein